MPGDIVLKNGGIIGVSDHGGWAVLVTVARDGALLDRRRVELVGEGLPKLPHHSEGQRLPLDEAVELVERVRVSAEKHSNLRKFKSRLDDLVRDKFPAEVKERYFCRVDEGTIVFVAYFAVVVAFLFAILDIWKQLQG